MVGDADVHGVVRAVGSRGPAPLRRSAVVSHCGISLLYLRSGAHACARLCHRPRTERGSAQRLYKCHVSQVLVQAGCLKRWRSRSTSPSMAEAVDVVDTPANASLTEAVDVADLAPPSMAVAGPASGSSSGGSGSSSGSAFSAPGCAAMALPEPAALPPPAHNAAASTQRRPPQPSAAAAAAPTWPTCSLLDLLPDEIFLHMVRQLLRLPCGTWSAVRVRQVSAAALARLAPLWEEVKRLRIRGNLSRNTRAPRGGWMLSCGGQRSGQEWACFGLLPAIGRCCWTVQVKHTFIGCGTFCAGVVTASGRFAWGLLPERGHIRRWHRDTTGRVCGHPVPPGYPNGHLAHALYDEEGKCVDLAGRCKAGTSIVIVFDADEGTLSIGAGRRGGGPGPAFHCPLREVVRGFPRGELLRPWVRVSYEDVVAIRPSVE